MENDRKLSEINYKPLEAMGSAWRVVMEDTLKVPASVSTAVLVVACLVAFFFIGQLAILVAVLIYTALASKVLSRKAKVWKDFAEANGWHVVLMTSSSPAYIPPSLFGLGTKPQMSDVVHATFEGHECDLFLYQFTTGSGKSKTTHFFTIARVILSKPFPHIILDSKKTWMLSQKGEATDSTKLEGDFSRYFSLHYREDDHINALSIVTPDVMHTLIQNNTAQDIEIIGTNLFFIMNTDKRDAQAMPLVLQSVDALADEISHKAKTLKYVAESSPAAQQIIQIAQRSAQSSDKVANTIVLVIILAIMMPLILAVVMGAIMSTY